MKLDEKTLQRIANEALLAVAEDDLSYLDQVVRQYEPIVFELAMSLTEEPAVAIDVLDEVFEQLRKLRADRHAEPISVLVRRLTHQTAALTMLSSVNETVH